VLKAVAAHDLVAPVQHGARVALPQREDLVGTGCGDDSANEGAAGDEDWLDVTSSNELEADRVAAYAL
jgi:hypothetical protein